MYRPATLLALWLAGAALGGCARTEAGPAPASEAMLTVRPAPTRSQADPGATRLAATVASTTPPPSTPLPESVRELFSDRFESVWRAWAAYSTPQASAGYRDGEFVIGVDAPRTRALSVPGGVAFGDTVIYVSVRRPAGPRDAGFGVVCRYRDDENYYFFLVTADNFAIIGKRAAGELIGLSSEVLLPIEPLLPGETPNLLTAACAGEQLILWVNARFIASARDPDMPPGGNIGLLAAAFDSPGVRVAFDDLSVFAP
ncbi:MAG: hypothetical protein HY784_04805 [Chloroflexi bacterium]|nr:hypothetical protein [Chloroflexota bacterium]